MRKLLVFIAVIFMFLCGITKTNAANYTNIQNTTTSIEACETNAYNAETQTADKYFISSNISHTYEFLFEGFGSVENDNFDINNLFIAYRNNLKSYNNMDEYLLSISSNPRAP